MNELLYWLQVLTYAQQSKELANIEQDKLAQRIQEFRTQTELDNLRASFDMEPSTSADGITVGGTSSYKNIEAIMQSTARGEVSNFVFLAFCATVTKFPQVSFLQVFKLH